MSDLSAPNPGEPLPSSPPPPVASKSDIDAAKAALLEYLKTAAVGLAALLREEAQKAIGAFKDAGAEASLAGAEIAGKIRDASLSLASGEIDRPSAEIAISTYFAALSNVRRRAETREAHAAIDRGEALLEKFRSFAMGFGETVVRVGGPILAKAVEGLVLGAAAKLGG